MNCRLACLLLGVLALALSVPPARAGHSRGNYVDGGQSMDGRYVLTPELVKAGDKDRGEWRFTWMDTRDNKTLTGKLVGLSPGYVHAHIFVAPGGDTFAVFNPRAYALTASPGIKLKEADPTTEEYQRDPRFAHRLVIYRKSGEVVKSLALRDFVQPQDFAWIWPFFEHVYWQVEYPGETMRNTPRSDYALYRVSPDYTMLEFTIGATPEVARKAKEAGKDVPPPRVMRVALTDGRILEPDEKLADPNRVPGRPFKGPLGQGGYVPSLDPVRVPGTYQPR